jgi:cytochrome c oxidase subunit I+III
MNPTLLHMRLQTIWENRPGLGALSAVNHTTVGLRFIVTGLLFFIIGGLLAMLIRTQIAIPNNDFVDHDVYNQLFTLHGTTMMFLFAVPVVEGVAMYLIPKLIGTRDMVFPRLSAYGYWCYLFGGILLYSSLLFGAAPDDGWFMYTPLTGPEFSPGSGPDFWLLGVTLAEVSAVSAAVELVVSILKTRAPGMALHRMPIFAWAMLVVALMILFGFPPLILGSVLLELERAFGLPFYDVARGGDPLLWQHLFWLFGHPEVYIIFLPAAGLLSTMIPVLAQRPLASYTWIVIALVATGFISFGLWVHHMYATGIPHMALSFFSAASMAVAIPTGIQVFTWIATLWPARPRVTVPMLYVFGFFFIFVLGGLTGVMVALVPFDWQVHDTHFVVAHLHYVLIGGLVFPLFAAIYYWLPLVSGRMPSEWLGKTGFWLIFIGFNLTFLVMHLTGMLGMPRRVYIYPEGLGWEWTNLISSIGGFVLSIGTAAFFLDVLLHFRSGARAPHNPWGADTLDWAMPHPPPAYNFAAIPSLDSRHPLWENPGLTEELRCGRGYLGHPQPKRREILATSVLDAKPEHVIVLPGNTWSPLLLAIVTATVFIGFLVKTYWLSAAAFIAVLIMATVWGWNREKLPAQMDVAPGVALPLQHRHSDRPGWWGMLMSLAADATVAASLMFGYFFYWTVSPNWPPAEYRFDTVLPAVVGLLLLIGSSAAFIAARGDRRRRGPLLAALGLLIGFALATAWFVLQVDINPTRHAYDAIITAIVAWQAIHVLACLCAGILLVLRRVPESYASERRIVALLWHYTALQGALMLGALAAFPWLV